MGEMFCFQCEQTAAHKGCCGSAGVCGKAANNATLQDKLTGALITLAVRTNDTALSEETSAIFEKGLFTTVTNVNFSDTDINKTILMVEKHQEKLFGNIEPEFDMQTIWHANEDIRSLKSLILFGMRGMAAYACHARVLGYTSKEVDSFLQKGLASISLESNPDELLKLVLETGKANLACMELLDKANTESYGTPEPKQVTMEVEKGPFIVISGHDLHDLKLLLEQTKGTGVNVYTHGEMLPAHGYPLLAEYENLKGHFGTAWQNQQKEFIDLPAPVLFTTNCLMPPKENYASQIFTTAEVGYDELVHIGEDKDFTPVIERALELKGYNENKQFEGINGGSTLMTGFGHGAVLGVADQVIDAIKKGEIKHIFLVGGCDGAKTGRNYYTEFVRNTPDDTLILTLACGKFRFNDLNLGTVAGLPRVLDMGQCNDAYSAIKVAVALAEAFDCTVNDLPLTFVLSWYEQKAVAILETLLYLDIKNIKLGPTLPAFLSENILNALVDVYGISPIGIPKEDVMVSLG